MSKIRYEQCPKCSKDENDVKPIRYKIVVKSNSGKSSRSSDRYVRCLSCNYYLKRPEPKKKVKKHIKIKTGGKNGR